MKIETAINNECRSVHDYNIEAGWYDNPREYGTLLALIHSEVSEMRFVKKY